MCSSHFHRWFVPIMPIVDANPRCCWWFNSITKHHNGVHFLLQNHGPEVVDCVFLGSRLLSCSIWICRYIFRQHGTWGGDEAFRLWQKKSLLFWNVFFNIVLTSDSAHIIGIDVAGKWPDIESYPSFVQTRCYGIMIERPVSKWSKCVCLWSYYSFYCVANIFKIYSPKNFCSKDYF